MPEQCPVWRGHLRIALVSCPIALYSANHERGSLHFNLINSATGNRIKMITQDADTGAELSRQDLVKGYEYKKDTYLVVEESDFEAARVESSSTLVIDKFDDRRSVDPIYFDASYYVAPDGDAGQDVYAVLREALGQSGKMALSRVVIARRERAIAWMPLGRGLVAHTLHETRDLNRADALFDELPDARPNPEMVKLAIQLIDRQVGEYNPADVEDRYETRLRAIIDAKLKGEGVDPVEENDPDSNDVIDLMAALRQSLGQKGRGQKIPVRRPTAKSATMGRKTARQSRAR